MDYEKKYKEAIEKIRNLLDEGEKKGYTIVAYEKDFESIFPELKQSEDEKIKHEIKIILANTDLSQFALDYTFADMITWLNKQGQVKESTISQHEIEKCKENDNSLTSKDEKIRKGLIHQFTTLDPSWDTWRGMKRKDILVWLEKQKHGEVAIEGQVRDHNFIDFDSSGTSFMIPVPNHNLKCGDKVLVKILKIE